jgi:hypothetical protein
MKAGQTIERGRWCELQRFRKLGDMDLPCLKLFLDGAGESLMEKGGYKIMEL